ncbi:MAG: hypothetical protein IE928_02695 [Gammaproteobacteria bacterium]|nr:hypothetical protein [Gammaproteobacteria bacterium]
MRKFYFTHLKGQNMGFEHWIMNNFWPVIIGSLVLLVIAHFAVAWLMRQGGKKHTDETQD